MDKFSSTSETIYLTGPPSTGKTTLVKEFLNDSKPHVHIDCANLSSPTQLYCDIISGLTDDTDLVCNSRSFVSTFLALLLAKKRVKKFIIALDNAHCLKTTKFMSCLPFLLHLDELIDGASDDYKKRHHVQIILVDSMVLRDFSNFFPPDIRGKLLYRCKVVALSPWNKKDLIERISSFKPIKRADSYPVLVNNIVNLHYKQKTKDYLELKNLCEENFERFIKDFNDDEEIDMSFFKRDKLLEKTKEIAIEEQTKDRLSLDMLLLITSAYIASFSTARDDKVNFVKSIRKTKRRKIHEADSCQNIRPFTLERLLQIYKRLSDPEIHERLDNPKREDLVDSVLANIRVLLELNYLRNVGLDGLGCLTKFSIAENIDYRYAKYIASRCEVELDNYLR